jgi:hypothetical protein
MYREEAPARLYIRKLVLPIILGEGEISCNGSHPDRDGAMQDSGYELPTCLTLLRSLVVCSR